MSTDKVKKTADGKPSNAGGGERKVADGKSPVANIFKNEGKSVVGEGKNVSLASYIPRLKKLYNEKIAKELISEFSYTSAMQAPRLVKIVVSMGVGEAISDKKLLEAAVEELTLITGQKGIKTTARKSIANFKIRARQEIGTCVTLRGAMMYEFLDRLVNVALPRVKDFRGINQNAFDGHGNYALGIMEQIIFPEIDFDKIVRVSGLNVVIVTSAKTDAEAKSFLTKFGMPFRK
jgi:large subunit ribosomal protein L5